MSIIWSEAQQAYLEDNGMEKYLGDGLYASFDGFGVTLRAPREGGDHYVYLEPQQFIALDRYLVDVKEHFKKQINDGSYQ